MGGDGGDDVNALTPAMTRLIIQNILRDIISPLSAVLGQSRNMSLLLIFSANVTRGNARGNTFRWRPFPGLQCRRIPHRFQYLNAVF